MPDTSNAPRRTLLDSAPFTPATPLVVVQVGWDEEVKPEDAEIEVTFYPVVALERRVLAGADDFGPSGDEARLVPYVVPHGEIYAWDVPTGTFPDGMVWGVFPSPWPVPPRAAGDPAGMWQNIDDWQAGLRDHRPDWLKQRVAQRDRLDDRLAAP